MSGIDWGYRSRVTLFIGTLINFVNATIVLCLSLNGVKTVPPVLWASIALSGAFIATAIVLMVIDCVVDR